MSPGWRSLAASLVIAASLPVDASASEELRALWIRHCGPCHLQGGTGTFMLGRRLGADKALLERRDDLTAGYVRAVVRQGIQSMPRFSRAELPDDQLDRIAQYLSAPETP